MSVEGMGSFDEQRTLKDQEIVLTRERKNLQATLKSSRHARRIATILWNYIVISMALEVCGRGLRTGTVYRILGLTLPAGQFSRTLRREDEMMPLESVSISTGRDVRNGRSERYGGPPIISQCNDWNIGMTPLDEV